MRKRMGEGLRYEAARSNRDAIPNIFGNNSLRCMPAGSDRVATGSLSDTYRTHYRTTFLGSDTYRGTIGNETGADCPR